MNNKKSAEAFLSDAKIILEESRFSFEKGHWHRVIRKCQEATELGIKGLFRYLGIEYPKSHILGRVIKKELNKYNLFSKEELGKIALISDTLAFDREPSFYGSPEGTPAAKLFDQDDAEEAIGNAEWVINIIRKIIER
jgi:HEPN domain-containing protein